MICPSCGASAPASARFCPSCGHALATRGDERRIVTVVFADLVGFTTMSESRDPEHIKNLVDSSFARLAADVTSHGGRVDKVVGDALMALFGAPVAHEDDAERAVRCALAMQKTVAALAAEANYPLALRVGVNTGEVLVGAIRAGGDYTAMGDVVNVASRLQTAATPGTVVVGASTYGATSAAIIYESIGALTVKGRDEPVHAWIAGEALAPPGRRPKGRRSPLVGREGELALLRATLTTTFARRRPSIIVVLGEAGVGKTRLAEEAGEIARTEHGALVLEGRCVPYGEANVWWPMAEAVRQACELDDAAGACDDERAVIRERMVFFTGLQNDDPEVDRLVAGLVYVLGDPDALSEVDPARAPAEVRRSLEALMQGLARRQPLMVMLSELHWADDVVLQLIDDLLERANGQPVLVLATARPDLEARWSPPPGRHNAVALHLDPLDDDAAAELLSSLFEGAAHADVQAAVLERAGGNPLFLEELAALLANAPVGRPLVRDLPATLRGLVAARIDSLDAAARNALEDASVIGRTGRVDALGASAAARGTALGDEVIDELIARDLISEDAGAWEFKSELVREVAYDTLTKAERARRHAAHGLWLSERRRASGREDDELEPIAYHLGVAASLRQSLGEIDGVPNDIAPRALRAIERAAMRAKQRGLHSGSLRLLDRALELLDAGDRANRHRVLLARASANANLRQLDDANADLDLVAAEVNDDEVATRAQIQTLRGQVRQTAADFTGSMEALDHAIALWRDANDPAGEAVALRLAGMTQLFSGDNARADALLKEALGAFRALGDRQGEAWALQNRAWLSFNQGLLEEADARLAEAADMFTEIGDYGGLGFVKGMLGFVRLFQGRFEEAGALAEQILASERDLDDRWAYGMMLLLLSSVRLFTGRPDEAVAPAAQAAELFEALGDVGRRVQAMCTEARAVIALGRVEDGFALLRAATDPGDEGSFIGVGVISAAVAIQLGEPGLARAALGAERSVDSLGMGTVADHEGQVLHALAELLSGDFRAARDALERLLANSTNEGQVAYANAGLALAAVADAMPDLGVAAAKRAAAAEGGTYLDRQLALTAEALAAAQTGRGEEALALAAELIARAEATTDLLARTTALLVRAAIASALDASSAEEFVAAADAAVERLGAPLLGWRAVFAAGASGKRDQRPTSVGADL